MIALRIYPRKDPRVSNGSALTTPTQTKTAPWTCVGLARVMISKGGLAGRAACIPKKRVKRRVCREALMGGEAKREAEACRGKPRDLSMLTEHQRENSFPRGALGARLIGTVAHKAGSKMMMRGVIGGGQEQLRKEGE